MSFCFTKERFVESYKLIQDYLKPTPLIKNDYLSSKFNCELYLKLENLQPVGSFKVRGALNKLASLKDEEKKKGVLAVSAGNHAQGVAYAAKVFGIKAIIIMPLNAPLIKVQNTRKLGAKVILHGEQIEESFAFAKDYLQKNDHVYIHPFKDQTIIEGQGSLAFELNEQLPDMDYVVSTIGGGGLVAGIGKALKYLGSEAKVIAAQAQGANSMIQSLAHNKIQKVDKVSTFADGIKVRDADSDMLKVLNEVVYKSNDVSDDDIASSVLELMEQARIIAEGAAALTLSSFEKFYRESPKDFRGKKVVLVICGGNIDINLIDQIIDRGLVKSSRRMNVSLMLDDSPGQLSRIVALIAENEGNILHIHHDRNYPYLALSQTRVEIAIETKNKEHADQLRSLFIDNYKIIKDEIMDL